MARFSFGWSGRLVLTGLVLAACGGRSTRSDMTGAVAEGGGANDGAIGTGGTGVIGTGGTRVVGTGGTGVVGTGGTGVVGTGGTGVVGTGGTDAVGGSAVGAGAVGGTRSAVGGSGGVPATGPEECVVDGIRRTVGGNSGTGPLPSVVCQHLSAFYCPGESYDIDTGPCEGTCTCTGDGAWDCDYVNPQPGGDCTVKSCVDGPYTLDVGSSVSREDGCTVCQCTSQGLLCSSVHCERKAFCDDLEDQFADALLRATSCDPNSIVSQCTERFPLVLGCENLEVPVNVTEELAVIAAKFRSHGCYKSPSDCPATTRVRGAASCRPEGFCSDAP